MRNLLICACCVLGGSFATSISAQDSAWRTKIETTSGRVNQLSLGKPTPITLTTPPVPVDAAVQPASYASDAGMSLAPIVRAKFSETAFGAVDSLSPPSPLASQGMASLPIPPSPDLISHLPEPPENCDPSVPLLGQDAILMWEEVVGGIVSGRFYFRGEYLSWWLPGQRLPALVTTSPAVTPENNLGVLGQNTTILFGNSTLNSNQFSGVRLSGGYWLDPCQLCGVEGSVFYLAPQTSRYSFDSANYPVLARPIQIQNINNQPSRELTATPGLSPDALFQLNGRIDISLPTQFWGADVNFRKNLCSGCDYRVDLLAGFRYLDLKEGLQIVESLTTQKNFPEPSANPPIQVLKGDQFVSTDFFSTHNQFYGGQVGISGEFRRNRWIFGATAKLALGVVQESIDVQGTTTLIQAASGNRITETGGLYAQQSNIGRSSQSHFAVAPELGLKVGYQLTDHINAFVGYNFLYISNVVRPGDQIDTSIDIRQAPFAVGQTVALPPVSGVQHPVVPFQQTSFWAQGVNIGLEIRY